MIAVSRLYVSLALLVLLLVGAGYTRPEFGADLEDSLRVLAFEREREDRLNQEMKAGLRRLDAKLALVGEVIRGGVGLTEAAGRFREVNGVPSRLHRLFPGASEDECLCREVIGWVRCELWARSGGDARLVAAVIGALEAEMERLRGDDGAVVLPGD